MLDPSGRITTWNPGAQRFKGYTADEIIGQNFSVFFTPEDREAGLPERGAARQPWPRGASKPRAGASARTARRFWANAVLDPDLRSRRRRTSASPRSPATSPPSGNMSGRCSKASSASGCSSRACAITPSTCSTPRAMSPTGIRARRASRAIPPTRSSASISPASTPKRIAPGASRSSRSRRRFAKASTNARPGASARTEPCSSASVVLDPIFDENGKHVGFAKITRDITERKKAQDELEEARTSLFQSQKLQALGELTGGIAHDFNNLMTVVAGSADFLLRKPDLPDAKRRQYLEAIAETADRATMLTNHLLAFGRRQPIKPEVFDLNLRLDALAEVLSSGRSASNIERRARPVSGRRVASRSTLRSSRPRSSMPRSTRATPCRMAAR